MDQPRPEGFFLEKSPGDKVEGGPVFSKFFRLDRTDPLSFGPKFPEILVELIAPRKNKSGDYNGDLQREPKKRNGLISRTTTLHVHHGFFVHFFAVPPQLRREMTKF